MSRPIYLDYNATTPIAPEVAESMNPFLYAEFGNPSSGHLRGQIAREAVANARAEVSALVGAAPSELFFTGSATEANNLALLGVARALPEKRHIIISAVEHPAVMQPALHLRELGWEVTVLPVDTTGRVDPASVFRSLRPETALVSVMHANNEVGTLQPIAEIAAIARAHGCLMHTDAAQSAGKVPLDVAAMGVDLLTLAGHKFYAPKGIGALYVRTGTPIKPIQFGADQEQALRPGTENVSHIVGLGVAAKLAREQLTTTTSSLLTMRTALYSRLSSAVPGLLVNGHPEHCLPNTLHVSFPAVSGRDLLAACAEQVSASVGSACHSHGDAVSGVLEAMACTPERARGAVRLSVGKMTTLAEIEAAAAALVRAWKMLA